MAPYARNFAAAFALCTFRVANSTRLRVAGADAEGAIETAAAEAVERDTEAMKRGLNGQEQPNLRVLVQTGRTRSSGPLAKRVTYRPDKMLSTFQGEALRGCLRGDVKPVLEMRDLTEQGWDQFLGEHVAHTWYLPDEEAKKETRARRYATEEDVERAGQQSAEKVFLSRQEEFLNHGRDVPVFRQRTKEVQEGSFVGLQSMADQHTENHTRNWRGIVTQLVDSWHVRVKFPPAFVNCEHELLGEFLKFVSDDELVSADLVLLNVANGRRTNAMYTKLHVGDWITQFGDTPVKTKRELIHLIENAKQNELENFELELQRQDGVQEQVVPLSTTDADGTPQPEVFVLQQKQKPLETLEAYTAKIKDDRHSQHRAAFSALFKGEGILEIEAELIVPHPETLCGPYDAGLLSQWRNSSLGETATGKKWPVRKQLLKGQLHQWREDRFRADELKLSGTVSVKRFDAEREEFENFSFPIVIPRSQVRGDQAWKVMSNIEYEMVSQLGWHLMYRKNVSGEMMTPPTNKAGARDTQGAQWVLCPRSYLDRRRLAWAGGAGRCDLRSMNPGPGGKGDFLETFRDKENPSKPHLTKTELAKALDANAATILMKDAAMTAVLSCTPLLILTYFGMIKAVQTANNKLTTREDHADIYVGKWDSVTDALLRHLPSEDSHAVKVARTPKFTGRCPVHLRKDEEILGVSVRLGNGWRKTGEPELTGHDDGVAVASVGEFRAALREALDNLGVADNENPSVVVRATIRRKGRLSLARWQPSFELLGAVSGGVIAAALHKFATLRFLAQMGVAGYALAMATLVFSDAWKSIKRNTTSKNTSAECARFALCNVHGGRVSSSALQGGDRVRRVRPDSATGEYDNSVGTVQAEVPGMCARYPDAEHSGDDLIRVCWRNDGQNIGELIPESELDAEVPRVEELERANARRNLYNAHEYGASTSTMPEPALVDVEGLAEDAVVYTHLPDGDTKSPFCRGGHKQNGLAALLGSRHTPALMLIVEQAGAPKPRRGLAWPKQWQQRGE